MPSLIYFTAMSLDGYIEDEDGSFGWAAPDEEVHRFANDVARPVRTYLYGRRMYETMTGWETDPSHAAASDWTRDFAEIWRAADKVVYSRSLEEPVTSRTRIEREFDPEAVRDMKQTAESDLLIGGAELAGEAARAGLIDELRLVVAPVVVGAGKPALQVDMQLQLELLEEGRFESGFASLRYRVKPA
jgi:dihydrofolate reductase